MHCNLYDTELLFQGLAVNVGGNKTLGKYAALAATLDFIIIVNVSKMKRIVTCCLIYAYEKYCICINLSNWCTANTCIQKLLLSK